MIGFDPKDKNLEVYEIEELMKEFDSSGVFSTRFKYKKNFYIHYIKLITKGQVMTHRNVNTGKVKGLCSWALVDKDRKRQINKTRWLLPENVSEGDILYLDTCLITESKMIYDIKKHLNSLFKDKVKEVFWYNVDRSRYFHSKIKGGVPCLTTVG